MTIGWPAVLRWLEPSTARRAEVKVLEWLAPFQHFTPDWTGHGAFWQPRRRCRVPCCSKRRYPSLVRCAQPRRVSAAGVRRPRRSATLISAAQHAAAATRCVGGTGYASAPTSTRAVSRCRSKGVQPNTPFAIPNTPFAILTQCEDTMTAQDTIVYHSLPNRHWVPCLAFADWPCAQGIESPNHRLILW